MNFQSGLPVFDVVLMLLKIPVFIFSSIKQYLIAATDINYFDKKLPYHKVFEKGEFLKENINNVCMAWRT